MPNARRSQLVAALAAVVLLAGAWLVTARGDDDASAGAPTIPTTAAPRATTTSSTTTPPKAAPAPDPATLRNGLAFTDVTAEAGLAEPHSADTPDQGDVVTGGVAAADYDGDGDQDLFITRLGLPNRLMRNDGTGHFTDVAAEAGVGGTDVADGSAAALWADLDGDGDLDLFTTGAGNGRHTLFVNDGTGHFTDGTEAANLVMPPFVAGLPGTLSYGAGVADWDHDGDLDLAVLQWYRPEVSTRLPVEPTPNGGHADLCARRPKEAMTPTGTAPRSLMRLYENLGGGRFVDELVGSNIDADQIAGSSPCSPMPTATAGRTCSSPATSARATCSATSRARGGRTSRPRPGWAPTRTAWARWWRTSTATATSTGSSAPSATPTTSPTARSRCSPSAAPATASSWATARAGSPTPPTGSACATAAGGGAPWARTSTTTATGTCSR
ncbi:MAG: FG-GAP-like repeat-containing protein [Acidimicrobiales bacterium]